MSKRYEKAVAAVFGPVAGRVAWNSIQRLLGFWVCYHTLGGVHGLLDLGWQSSTIYRNIADFREAFGIEVGDFMPEAVAAMMKEAGRVQTGRE